MTFDELDELLFGSSAKKSFTPSVGSPQVPQQAIASKASYSYTGLNPPDVSQKVNELYEGGGIAQPKPKPQAPSMSDDELDNLLFGTAPEPEVKVQEEPLTIYRRKTEKKEEEKPDRNLLKTAIRGTGLPALYKGASALFGVAKGSFKRLIGATAEETGRKLQKEPVFNEAYVEKGKQLIESGTPPPEDRLARAEYNFFTTYYKKKKISEQTQEKVNPMAEELKAFGDFIYNDIPEKDRMRVEDAQKFITSKEALKPENAGKTASAVMIVAADQSANTAVSLLGISRVGMLPAAYTMMAQEKKGFIDNASQKYGISDENILDTFGDFYAIPSGAIEYGMGTVITAPFRAMAKGKKFVPAASKIVSKVIKNSVLKGAISGVVGTIGVSALEGTEELTQAELQDAVSYWALTEAARQDEENADYYVKMRDSINLKPLTKEKFDNFIIGFAASLPQSIAARILGASGSRLRNKFEGKEGAIPMPETLVTPAEEPTGGGAVNVPEKVEGIGGKTVKIPTIKREIEKPEEVEIEKGLPKTVNYEGEDVEVNDKGQFYPKNIDELAEKAKKIVEKIGGTIPESGVIDPGYVLPKTGEIIREPQIAYIDKDKSHKYLSLDNIEEAPEKSTTIEEVGYAKGTGTAVKEEGEEQGVGGEEGGRLRLRDNEKDRLEAQQGEKIRLPEGAVTKDEVIKSISDRKARLQQRIKEITDPQAKADTEHEALDELLGEKGVTSFKDAERTKKELEVQGVDYILERDDGRNLGGANAKLGHEGANDAIKQIWGDVWAAEVRKAGGIPFRGTGDEMKVIWPDKTLEEVQTIRAGIAEKIDAKVKELGLSEIPHAKGEYGGLPTGALNIEYGFSEFKKNEEGVVLRGDMEREADEKVELMKQRIYKNIAEKSGYTHKGGKYVHTGIPAEKQVAVKPPPSETISTTGGEGKEAGGTEGKREEGAKEKLGEFKVGDILDPQGNTNMSGKVTIRKIIGNTLKFVDEEGTEFSGMAASQVRKLIEGGSWKRLAGKAGEEKVTSNVVQKEFYNNVIKRIEDKKTLEEKGVNWIRTMIQNNPKENALLGIQDVVKKAVGDETYDIVTGTPETIDRFRDFINNRLKEKNGYYKRYIEDLSEELYEKYKGQAPEEIQEEVEETTSKEEIVEPPTDEGLTDIEANSAYVNNKPIVPTAKALKEYPHYAKLKLPVHISYMHAGGIRIKEAGETEHKMGWYNYKDFKLAPEESKTVKEKPSVKTEVEIKRQPEVKYTAAGLTREQAIDAYKTKKLIVPTEESGLVESQLMYKPLKIQTVLPAGQMKLEGYAGWYEAGDFKLAEKATEEKPVSTPSKIVEGTETPNEKLINTLAKRLSQPEKITNTRGLLDYADKVYGGTIAQGKYGIRDVYDALETAMNKRIEEDGLPADAKDAMNYLTEQQEKLPTQTIRTTEQVELQQFSTPPAEAYIVTEVAGIKKGMTVLEPSAGNGNIATLARMKGADVRVNEIDPRRRANLSILGYEPTDADAEYLNSTLPENIQPDVVVMNPPFSSTGGRLLKHDTGFGAEHVRQALLRLKEGGRLVAIVGRGMAFGKPKMAAWWNNIARKYNVRANVGISGKTYAKYGTGFDNNIIVIDKTGPTESLMKAISGTDLTAEQAYEKLKPLSEEDVYGRIKTVPTKAGEGLPAKGEEGVGEGTTTGAPAPVGTVGRGRRPTAPDRRGAEREAVDNLRESGEQLPGELGGGNIPSVAEGAVKREAGVTEEGELGERAGGGTGATEREQARLSKIKEVGKIEEEHGGVYAKYKVHKATYEGVKAHPAHVSESVVMASVEPPDVKYELHLPKNLIQSGALSDIQLEAITYACQAHEQRLPDGSRKEYLLGDGTGIGKARELLGVIYENYLLGRKKSVYVTKSWDLLPQLQADMQSMGMKIPVIKLNEAGKEGIQGKEGILFSTYSTLSRNAKTDKERFKQVMDWLGKDFDGVFVFDESHSMKNVSETQFQGEEGDVRTLQEGSQRGLIGVEFKKALKEARFMDASATAATTPTNLAYLTRLGLWGRGTPFGDFISFLNVMREGGVGLMEILARDLKANGLYISRSISFDGEGNQRVAYDTVEHKLSEQEISTYDNMADFWSAMLSKVDEAAKNCNMKKQKQGIMKQFYATQQRFFLQLMMSFQVESMIKNAQKQLDDGNSVVISLYNTNESQVERQVAEAIASGSDLDAMEFSSKDMMKNMVERYFPIYQYEEYTDPETNIKITRQVTDKAGNPLINRENQAMQQKLIEEIVKLHIPENPLDRIVNNFGAKNVAEITGRKRRLIVDQSGRRTYQTRASKDVPAKRVNQHELGQFMDGKKRIAVISGAAATGFDLHASLRRKNQQRRVFYAMQLSWSADEQMQAFGRVHRTEQASAPEIVLVKTNIASQNRLVNTIQSRLASLGAMSKGGRETLSGGIFGIEDITDQYGAAALAKIYNRMDRATLRRMNLLDNDGNLKQSARGNVDGFLNRIMVLPFKQQNEIFENFYKEYRTNVDTAMAAGAYDVGVETIKGKEGKIVGEPEVLHTDKSSGVQTRLVTISTKLKTKKESFEDRMEMVNGLEPYINKRSGRAYLVKYNRGDQTHLVYGPRGIHEYYKSDEWGQFRESYESVDEEEAQKLWKQEYDKIKDFEEHRTTLITGSLFPVYDKIFFGEQRRKVKRAVLEDGTSHIGVEIPPKFVAKIKQNFGIGAQLYKASAKELYDLIKGNSIVVLDNGWQISERKVMGEKRIEIAYPPQNVPTDAEMVAYGAFGEIIQFNKRYFIPSDEEKAVDIIQNIINDHKPIRDAAAGGEQASIPLPEGKGKKLSPEEYAKIEKQWRNGDDVIPEPKPRMSLKERWNMLRGAPSGKKVKYSDASVRTEEHISWAPKEQRGEEFLTKPEKIYTAVKELAFPTQKLQDIAEAELGVSIEDAKNIDFKADKVRGSKAAAAEYVRTNLKPIFDAIESNRSEKYTEAVKYMVAKDTVWRYDNKPGYDDAGYSRETAQDMVDLVETGGHQYSQEIQNIAKQIWDYTENLRKYKLDHGVIDEALYESLVDPYYVPLYRDVSKAPARMPSKNRFTATSKGIMRLKGSRSGAPFIDPIQNIIRQTHETIENAARADFFNALVDLADRSEEVGRLIRELPAKWIKVGTIEFRTEIDNVLRPQMEALAKELGFDVIYKAKLASARGGRMHKVAGLFSDPQIKSMISATEGTVAHELGHGIHKSNPWLTTLVEENLAEMNVVADSRYMGEEVPVSYITYVRSTPEKVAEFISMYITDRAHLAEIAPNSIRQFEAKISENTILSKLKEMTPTNVSGLKSIEEANWVRDFSIPRDEDVISGLRGGKLMNYRVPIEVARAVKNLKPEMLPTWARILLLPQRIFRMGTVGLNPSFFMPNTARDTIDSAINTKNIPVFDYLNGMKSFIMKDKWYNAYLMGGGGMESTEAGITANKISAEAIKYGGEGGKFLDPYYWQEHGIIEGLTQAAWYAVKSPFRGLMYLGNISEMSTRIGTTRRELLGLPKWLHWYGGSGKATSLESAVHAARQGTGDFLRKGTMMGTFNEVFPFTNMAFEGLDRMVRTARDDPKRAMLKAFVYGIAPMLGFWVWNTSDDDRKKLYKAIPIVDKLNNWIIITGRNTWVKIPKAFIIKYFVNPIQIAWESATDYIAARPIVDWQTAMELPYQVYQSAAPLDISNIPPVVRMIVEPITNYDMWWRKDIEKPYIKGIPIPGMRWDKRTNEALKWVGKSLNISPIMLQHELELLGGGLFKDAVWVADMVTGNIEQERKLKSAPVIKRFMGKLNDWNSDMDVSIRDINELLGKMQDISITKLNKIYQGKPQKISELIKKNTLIRTKLINKRNELMRAKEEIKYLIDTANMGER